MTSSEYDLECPGFRNDMAPVLSYITLTASEKFVKEQRYRVAIEKNLTIDGLVR
ncbi:hypothetical protein GYMLUDRAFT_372813 [Collybiopsis luxurians FD-317 M1]|uniref:Uncharacterized protein n=1 Tax=Collybiopsis luxurians FD-317 M1 TaxID=944289 RepID=A0A0D0BR11_9AGAR|nr:hypothetical protein GYMLUDRAFT_372813 [Collybiopsis luxurians FD-317 M1]